MDTLAVQLTLPTTKRVRDFHPIAINHASHTRFDLSEVKMQLTYAHCDSGGVEYL
jgi:hypothetical protein